uniref:Uncharacterized protein n=1 Tax=Sexangularia sp. CB-2014 TaxID=1486929 RepID=A0A7S1VEQ3_9EUKA|mmetsp:Transcript_2178/g.6896  ORF Transcript_2178/g.6896 Transcript_2178/m.6896 type:complete len:246 (+) Transcript_2178:103-840(+)
MRRSLLPTSSDDGSLTLESHTEKDREKDDDESASARVLGPTFHPPAPASSRASEAEDSSMRPTPNRVAAAGASKQTLPPPSLPVPARSRASPSLTAHLFSSLGAADEKLSFGDERESSVGSKRTRADQSVTSTLTKSSAPPDDATVPAVPSPKASADGRSANVRSPSSTVPPADPPTSSPSRPSLSAALPPPPPLASPPAPTRRPYHTRASRAEDSAEEAEDYSEMSQSEGDRDDRSLFTSRVPQ